MFFSELHVTNTTVLLCVVRWRAVFWSRALHFARIIHSKTNQYRPLAANQIASFQKINTSTQ